MKLVLVEWIDSNRVSGWWNKHDILDEKKGVNWCISVGVLIKENKKEVGVCLNQSGEVWGDVIYIPRCAVRRIRQLKISLQD